MKQSVLALLFALFTITTFSQSYTPPSYADIDNNHRNYVNTIFGNLEPNRVPTGLLIDYGFEFTDPSIYNGTVLHDSTLMEQGLYSDLYKTLYTSRFNTNAATMLHPSLYDSLCYIARQKQVITLSGLLFKYNAIQADANTSGKVQTTNGQLYDVYNNGVWQNPYNELNTIAISPSTIRYDLTYCSVVLPSSLWLGNRNSDIASMEFDAADGLGYRSLQFDTPIALNYADTGWKHWVFRITLTNNQQLYSHSKVHFSNTSNIAGNTITNGNVTTFGSTPNRTSTIVASEAYLNHLGSARIVISYRNPNDQVLRRPLIIAEGLDPGHITKPEAPEGSNTFNNFIISVINSNSAALQSLITDNPSAYDIVYVNWNNGTDYLQRNALVLEEVIRWVNANKQPLNGVRQPNVVLGSSMGGVIARMALGRMDRGQGNFNGTGGYAAHETSLYVSLDAPHQGANVPLGYQAAARHATQMYISTGPLALTVEVIQMLTGGASPLATLTMADQPAPRQLLTNRIGFFYNTANTDNQQFLQELKTSWAYPTNIRCIAISNGSECAIDQEFSAGSTLLHHYRSTKTRFISDLIGMAAGAGLTTLHIVSPAVVLPLIIPGSSKFELTLDVNALANGGGNQVYYGNIRYTKKVLWLVPISINIANKTYTAPSGLLPLDVYPGSMYVTSMDNQPSSASQDWAFTYDNNFFIQRRFMFIPTTSALDIGSGNTTLTTTNYYTRYIGGTPPVAPLNSPFANFSTAFNSSPIFFNYGLVSHGSEDHEGLYIRSSNWLAEELNGNNAIRTNCSAFCSNSSITATGNVICNSQSFTAPFGNGVNYVWTVDNPSLVNLVSNGNTVNVTRNGSSNGVITLSVNITSSACGNSTLQMQNIQVGAGNPPSVTLNYDNICGKLLQAIPTNLASGTTGFNWVVTGAKNLTRTTSTTDTYGGDLVVRPFQSGLTVGNTYYSYLTVQAITNCGLSDVNPYIYNIIVGPYSPGNCVQVYLLSTKTLGQSLVDDVVAPPASRLKIYPNPISTMLYVLIPSDSVNLQKATITITDISGRQVKQINTVSESNTIPVSTWANGTYVVTITDGKQKIVKKIVKN